MYILFPTVSVLYFTSLKNDVILCIYFDESTIISNFCHNIHSQYYTLLFILGLRQLFNIYLIMDY